MDLLWPWFIFLLALVPLILAVYIWALRRRTRLALRYSSLAILRPALDKQSRWRRHLPFAFFLIAMTAMIVALSRPVAIVTVPSDQTIVILTLDVSGSMRANDIKPNRLAAAEAAALDFIQRQKASTQIGIVAFAGYAQLIQAPTTDQEALQGAIQRLSTARSTAIGSGILQSLDAIAEVDREIAPSQRENAPLVTATPVPKGAYAPAIIVLLTDGVNNAGPMPLDAAQQAVERGVRVYTIGFGTPNGTIPDQLNGGQFGGRFGGGGGFGGGGQFGGGFRSGIDEATLKQIADMTGGEYHSASSAGELQSVFQNLPTYLITKHETMEITSFFTAFGALLTIVAIGLALKWHPLA